MPRDVVELVVRFGDTILDVIHVGADETFRIGTARDVDLAVPGYTSYPLVDRGRARHPHLQLGLVTIDATYIEREHTRLPHRRPDWRPPAFIAASLVVHLTVWLLAILLEPFERLVDEPRPPRLRPVHIAHEPPPEPEPPKPKPSPAAEPRATPAAPPEQKPPAGKQARRARPSDAASEAVPRSFGATARDVADTIAKIDVERRVGDLKAEDTYNEDDYNSRGFGGGRRLPPGEIIKTGDYETMSYNVTLCPAKSCSVRGPIPSLYIRTHLHEVMRPIYGCYAEHASGPGTIVLEFTIDVDGMVQNAKGSGLGETGACAAQAITSLYFKALGKDAKPGQATETRVRYPIRFNE